MYLIPQFVFFNCEIHIKFIILKCTIQRHLVHSQWCTNTTSISKALHHHQNKPYMPVSSLSSCPQSPQNSDLISISIDLLILDISYKWNHMLCGLLCLASLTEHHALKAQSPCREYQCFSPFHSWNISHLDHWSFHTFSVFLCSCCSITQLCQTLCNYMNCSTQVLHFPVLPYLLEFV